MVSSSPGNVSSHHNQYPVLSRMQYSGLTGAARFCLMPLWLLKAMPSTHLLRAACCISNLPLEWWLTCGAATLPLGSRNQVL